MTNMQSSPQPETPDPRVVDWDAHRRIVQATDSFLHTIPWRHRGAEPVQRALGFVGTDRPIPRELEDALNDLRMDP